MPLQQGGYPMATESSSNFYHPIFLEIGMGKGDFIKGMAEAHPDWNFIGVEKYESVLVRGVSFYIEHFFMIPKVQDHFIESVSIIV